MNQCAATATDRIFSNARETTSLNHFPIRIVQQIDLLERIALQIEDEQLAQRMLISLNNICESIGHVSTQKMDSETYDLGVLHG